MKNKKLTEEELDFQGWKNYIESLYESYKRLDEANEKEKIEKLKECNLENLDSKPQ